MAKLRCEGGDLHGTEGFAAARQDGFESFHGLAQGLRDGAAEGTELFEGGEFEGVAAGGGEFFEDAGDGVAEAGVF